jgi:antitoxin component YwqK of YwqJK toxin-antitoxin module
MKHFNLFLITTVWLGQLTAQPKGCDKLVQRGDTTVCQDFNGKGRVFREHYYLKSERIFTRRWRYKKNGEYECVQKNGKSAFAKMHGPAYRFYPDGKVKYHVVYYDGIRVGQCFGYYPSGALKQTCQMNDKGKEDGILVNYYENGQIEAKARWENGRLREIVEYKDEQGRDRPAGTFKDGNGDWIWYENGQPAIVYTYKEGKQVKKKQVKS